jgi:arsenate reductase-like glutaredoxin family protein
VGTGPAPTPVIQLFGRKGDRSTRAAIRFFKERRTPISFVDLQRHVLAPAELRRFVERLGARELLDESTRAYRDGGLGYLRMDDPDIVDRLMRDSSLLKLPLVRRGADVSVGLAEPTWSVWIRESRGA